MSQIFKSSSGNGGGAVDSVVGTGNIIVSPNIGNVVVSSNGMQVIRGPNVDMQVTGLTTIFTTTNEFLVNQIIFYGVNVVGNITNSELFNIGWTAPDYNELTNATSSFVAATGTYTALDFASSSPNLVIPALTNLVINVTQAVTTDGIDIQRVDVWGYYLT
jgi:hypothetical protein